MVGRDAPRAKKKEGKEGSGEEDRHQKERRARPRQPRPREKESEGDEGEARKGGRARNRRQEREDEEVLNGNALLSMLKSNPPKVTKYTKGELLSIARLPASSIRPPNLDPMIDKENKNSQLVVHGNRSSADNDNGDGRKERRQRRQEVQEDASQATAAPVGATASEKPDKNEEKGVPDASSVPQSAPGDGSEGSRADKWFERKPAEPSTSTSTDRTSPTTQPQNGAGRGVAAAPPRAQNPAQSAHAHAQAQAMHAAAYMQALQMNAAGRGYPGLPMGYNPFLFPYGNPYGYPGLDSMPPGACAGLGAGRGLDAAPSVAALTAMQARLAAASAGTPGGVPLGGFGQVPLAASASATMVGSPPAASAATASPSKKLAQWSPQLQAHAEPGLDLPLGVTPSDEPSGDGEDAGCSQS